MKRVLGWLGFFLRCPVCAAKYSMENIKVIEGETDESTSDTRLLIHSDCIKCKSSVMFSIAIDGPEIFTIATVTDLTSQDTMKFKDQEPITMDEVLATHEFLRSFDGDFKSALNK